VPLYSPSGGFDTADCFPVAADASAPGEPCVEPSPMNDGDDNCESGSVCLWIDPETGEGTCVELCTGSATAPECSTPARRCVDLGPSDPALALCVDACDPLQQQCPADGLVCYAVDEACPTCFPMAVTGTLFCVSDNQMSAPYGEPCNVELTPQIECEPSLFCAPADRVATCSGDASGCCTPLCDLNAPECPDAAMGMTCQPLFGAGDAPQGVEHVGVCVTS
jgi:hypothetical protein